MTHAIGVGVDAPHHACASAPTTTPGCVHPPTHPKGQTSWRQPRIAIFLSPSGYWLCYWMVLGLHFSTAIFSFFAGFVHLALCLPAVHASTSSLLISVALKRISGISYLVIAVLHLVAVGQMVHGSCQCRQLTLQVATSAVPKRKPNQVRPTTQAPEMPPASVISIMATQVTRWFRQLWMELFGSDGYTGINGPYFPMRILAREVLEVLLQSYQLWALSYSVSRVWINQFAVAAVVLNCWSIPLVSMLFRKNEAHARLMHLVADMALDFTCTIIVPVCIMFPYLLQFDWHHGKFPMSTLVDDVWFANALAEGRQNLVSTKTDYISSLLPHYGIFSCLRLVKRFVRRAPRPSTAKTHGSAIVPGAATRTKSKSTGGSEGSSSSVNLFATVPAESRGVRLVTACIVVWGAIVLGFHLQAASPANGPGSPDCRLHLHPWLATKDSCMVQHIHCYHRGINGSSHEIAAILDQIERSVLTTVVFLHCPKLAIPSNLVEFPRLSAIEVYNSTILDWPTEAAIKQSTHPSFINVYMAESIVDRIPDGLLHDQLPFSMSTVSFINCSIAELPENVGDVWASSSLFRIGLDGTKIQKIPFSFGKIRLKELWMNSNLIESFPDGMFATARFHTISLSGNPLQRLPDTVGDISLLTTLTVEYTNVSRLPSWASEWLKDRKVGAQLNRSSFFASPVCEPGNVEDTTEKWDSGICANDLESKYGRIPHEIFMKNRNLSSPTAG